MISTATLESLSTIKFLYPLEIVVSIPILIAYNSAISTEEFAKPLEKPKIKFPLQSLTTPPAPALFPCIVNAPSQLILTNPSKGGLHQINLEGLILSSYQILYILI